MANYPTSASTDANLFVAVNGLQTTLAVTVTDSATTLTVTSTTGFPATGYVTVDNNEVVKYTGISGADFTGCTRGADGTTALPHNSGVTVGLTVVAAHHNLLKDEVIAIETSLVSAVATVPTATTPATALTYLVNQGTYLSIKNYGAIGDGIADDTTAINSAVTALKTRGGGILYVPKGRYKITSTVLLDYMPATKILGEMGQYQIVDSGTMAQDLNCSFFVNAISGGGTMFKIQESVTVGQPRTTNITFDSVGFDCTSNAANIAVEIAEGRDKLIFYHCGFWGGLYGCTLTTTSVFNTLWRDCQFNSMGIAIYEPSHTGTDSLNTVVENCTIRDCTTAAIKSISGATWYIKNCVIEACALGVVFDGVVMWVVDGCHFEAQTGDDILSQTVSGLYTTSSCTVNNCEFSANAAQTQQIHLTGNIANMVITGNLAQVGGGPSVISLVVNTSAGKVFYNTSVLDGGVSITGATVSQVMDASSQSFAGVKTFTNKIISTLSGNKDRFQMHESSNNQDTWLETYTGAATSGLVLATNRDPETGTFTQTGQAAASIEAKSANASGSVIIKTSNTNNTTPVAALTIDGVGMTSALPLAMSAQKITGLADGTASTDAAAYGQVSTRALDSAVVHNTGTENIAGAKTFTTQAIIKGTVTNDDVAAGYVGEYVFSSQGTETNVAISGHAGDLTSISLTAGDWDVWGVEAISDNATGAVTTKIETWISTTIGDSFTGDTSDKRSTWLTGTSLSGTYRVTVSPPMQRMSLSGTTTVYLKNTANYTVGTPTATGAIFARRIR